MTKRRIPMIRASTFGFISAFVLRHSSFAFRRWLSGLRPTRSLGQRGEAAAAKFLQKLGYRIVERGARRRFGELDLVAVDFRGASGRTVVFVEVKTRASHDTGHPAEAVDAAKQRKMSQTALAYLKRHSLLESPSRFDVVAVTWPPNAKKPTIEHYKNAFEAQGRSMFG